MTMLTDAFAVVKAVYEVKDAWIQGGPNRDAQITIHEDQKLVEINLNLQPRDTADDALKCLGSLETYSFMEKFHRDPYDPDNPSDDPEGNLRIYLIRGSDIWVQVAIEWDLMKIPMDLA